MAFTAWPPSSSVLGEERSQHMAILGSWGFVLVYLLAAIKKELAEKLLVNRLRQVERLRSDQGGVLDVCG